MSSFQDTIVAAQASWRSNYSSVDEKWRLRQLHGLHQLVLSNRDTIVSVLSAEQAVPTTLYEREIAILVQELHSHMQSLEKEKSKSSVRQRPVGVAVILSNTENPIRYGLGPVAAAITAGNTVVFATTLKCAFISCLQLSWRKYMDSDTIFLAPGVDLSTIELRGIDQISILDHSMEKYTSILQSPKAHFHQVLTGSNFAIIARGKKEWPSTVQEILSHSQDQRLPSDRLSAVFVRVEEVSEFKAALLSAIQSNSQHVQPTHQRKTPHNGELSLWGSNIFELNLANTDLEHTPSKVSFEEYLQPVQGCGGLLIITITSLEKSIDLLANFDGPIQQLVLLAPSKNTEISYVRDWVETCSFSVDHICTNLRPVFDSFVSSGPSECIFPTALFSRSQTIAEQSVHDRMMSTISIRNLYKDLIQPLRAEPRGDRIGFFLQVEYLLKGATVSVLALTVAGLYCGFRTYLRTRK